MVLSLLLCDIDKKAPQVRDLWAHKDVDASAEFSTEVPPHGVVLLRVRQH